MHAGDDVENATEPCVKRQLLVDAVLCALAMEGLRF
jgi:hypothetical protein